MKNIGLEVKKVLTEKNMSVTDLAKKIKTSKQNLTSILNKPDMKASMLEKICEALDLSFDYFTDRSIKIVLPQNITKEKKPQVVVQIQLDEDQESKVLKMVFGKELINFLNK